MRNSRLNESKSFCSSSINSADLAIKLNNQDIMREEGTKLRESLMSIDFGLQDSLCDSADLKALWERIMMPLPVQTFLSAVSKVPK